MTPPPTATLPHSDAAERAVLGGILLHPRALSECIGHVEPRDFYAPAHEAIYAAMLDLDAASKPIDAVTIAAHMRGAATFQKLRAVDGESYFAALVDSVATVENIAYHAAMVAGRATVRRLVLAATDVASQGRGEYGDLETYLDTSARAIDEAIGTAHAQEPTPMRALHREGAARIEARYEARRNGGQIVGVPSGMAAYDALTGGWHPSELVVVAARPGVGKTAWALFASTSASRAGIPVLFVSLEMDRLALHDRLVSSAARVNGTEIRTGALSPGSLERMARVGSAIASLPIAIDDETGQTIAKIRAKVRRWRMKTAPVEAHPKALVIVDYLQIIAGQRAKNANRTEEVGTFSVGLKNLSRELRLPVIALAQLNRGVESRADKRPMLSDLRESGAIEQDADVVAFLHRPAMYDAQADREHAECIIGKSRNGQCATLRLRWQEDFTRFSDEATT